MDQVVEPCRNCESTNFEYDEEQCRNVCLQCNTMQEMTGIGVATIDLEAGIKYGGLQKVKQKRARKESKFLEIKNRIKNTKPFKLEDMFHWIFELQVESMRPHVNDWQSFKSHSEVLWLRYIKHTGSGFDIASASIDDLRLKLYPLGWGVPLDPNNAEETLNIVPREYYRAKRAEADSDSDVDIVKVKKNATKIKIEKMVNGRLCEAKKRKICDKKEDEDVFGSGSDEDTMKAEKLAVKLEVKEEMMSSLYSDSSESALSDEDDPSYLPSSYAFDTKEKNIVRVMRKKRESHVRFVGGRFKSHQLFMENNLLLLFYCLHMTQTGNEHCMCLMDIWRLARRRDIPFLKIGRFLPKDLYFLNHTVFQSTILRDKMPSFCDLKSYAISLAEILDFELFLRPLNNLVLVDRILKEKNLPQNLTGMIYNIQQHIEPKIDKYYKLRPDSSLIEVRSRWGRFKMNANHILFPELCCLGYIFMALRILLRLDGQFEFVVSELAKKLEESEFCDCGHKKAEKLFIWSDWLRESYRPATISTAKNWRDFDRIRSAAEFFEEDLERKDNYESELNRNDIVNSCGRFENPHIAGTHEDVLTDLMAPFIDIVNANKHLNRGPKTPIDFRDSCVKYLALPGAFRAEMRELANATDNSQHSGWSILEDLSSQLIARPMGWKRIALNDRRYPSGVFEELLQGERISDSEHELLNVLVYNSGIESCALYTFVDSLGKIMCKK